MFISRGLLLQWENFQIKKFGPALRSMGQKLYKLGGSIQGEYFREDRLILSQRCVPISNNVFPKLLDSEWVAPNCTIIGDVSTGKFSSFYHGVTLRGDTCKISVGAKSIIQDNTLLLNSDLENKNAQIKIGDKVTIGVNCRIDACTIEDGAFIGNGATIHKGCLIESGAMVAAGAAIPPNTVIPSRQIWAGNPGKYLRDLKPAEIVALSENLTELRELANVMVEETEKTQIQILQDIDNKNIRNAVTLDELLYLEMQGVSYWADNNKDEFGIEALQEGFGDLEDEDLFRYTAGDGFKKENMDLYYETDMTNYPDMLKVYGENYSKYEEMRSKFEHEVRGESPGWPDNTPPTRPGALRAWVSKWDPEYNTEFKQVGTQSENTNS